MTTDGSLMFVTMENLIDGSVVTIAVASVVSAFCLVWIATKLGCLVRSNENSAGLVEAVSMSTITSLTKIEQDGQLTRERDAQVAVNLADSITRADASPKDGEHGAAADAALRSESPE